MWPLASLAPNHRSASTDPSWGTVITYGFQMDLVFLLQRWELCAMDGSKPPLIDNCQ